ncbi:MAG: FAD-dependent monooxygenase [Rhodobacteraceae bacterium]|nr:FAD-dependent monooxygenase [Paracoccaceae bacterium]
MTQVNFSRPDYDVIVVGARPAGAATALNLARGGARVLVIDRAPPGLDTLSTHALMRAGVTLLDRWGVLPRLIAAGTPVVRRTVFDYGDQQVDVAIKPAGSVAGLYAPRRTVLDTTLANAAAEAGAELRYGERLELTLKDPSGRVRGVMTRDNAGHTRRITADLVIGADGRNSTVASLVGAEPYATEDHMSATVFGYFDAPASDAYRWIYRPGTSAGIIPTNDGQVCAFVSVAASRYRDALANDPHAAMRRYFAETAPDMEAVIAAGPSDKLRRFPGAPGFMRQSFGPGWALVGDAGYFKDPATAHGITDALRDADSLARAILSGAPGALAAWQATRDALSRDLFAITDRIAAHDWTPDELKMLHQNLHAVMKAEQAHVAQTETALAA